MRSTVGWKVRRAGRGVWTGTITVHINELPISVAGDGFNPRQALARAAIAMRAIANDPTAQAVLPPGTALAIEAIQNLAKAKDVGATLQRYGGKGARRLARVLGFG